MWPPSPRAGQPSRLLSHLVSGGGTAWNYILWIPNWYSLWCTFCQKAPQPSPPPVSLSDFPCWHVTEWAVEWPATRQKEREGGGEWTVCVHSYTYWNIAWTPNIKLHSEKKSGFWEGIEVFGKLEEYMWLILKEKLILDFKGYLSHNHHLELAVSKGSSSRRSGGYISVCLWNSDESQEVSRLSCFVISLCSYGLNLDPRDWPLGGTNAFTLHLDPVLGFFA